MVPSRDNQKSVLNTNQDAANTSIRPEPVGKCASWEPQITQSEYEAIKERVSAIETRISKEFIKLQSSLANNSMETEDTIDRRNGPERVLEKFERTLEETEMMNTSPMTEQLAKRLSRGLKIHSSAENRVFRSPSARKIGSIRRRSQENVRLTRNKSWHLGPNAAAICQNNVRSTRSSPQQPAITLNSPNIEKQIQIPRANLKRGRPNTFQNGLRSAQHSSEKAGEILSNTFTINNEATEEAKANDLNADLKNEQWVCANTFFGGPQTPTANEETALNSSRNSAKTSATKAKPARKRLNMNFDVTPTNSNSNTPRKDTTNAADTMKTPMLPPRLPVVKKTPAKTPHSIHSSRNLVNIATPLWQQEPQIAGRASIARLRSQNAGMVMAKAKLFDDLVVDQPRKIGRPLKGDSLANTNNNNTRELDLTSNFKSRLHQVSRPAANSPRRNKAATSGINRRQQLRAQRLTPIKKTPISLDKSLVAMTSNNNRLNRNTPSPAVQSPVTRRMALDGTPHAKGTLITKPPRRIITPQKKRKM